MRKTLIHLAMGALLAVPATASAVTAAELSAQLQALQLQLAQLQGGSVPSQACPQLSRVLKSGMSGSDVTSLQQFLARDRAVYPEGMVTGYFGALTQTAVQRWQVKNGIVSSGTPETTGYGVVGPRTIAAMTRNCGGASIGSTAPQILAGGHIQVTPTSGTIPLTISVVATVNTVRSCSGAMYTLDWGDGTPQQTITVPASTCGELTQTFTHTYANHGVFAVKLASGAHVTSVNVTVSPPAQSTSASTVASQGAVSIQMTPTSFTPKHLTISSGTTVIWTNTDGMPHTVTADNGSYKSGTMQPGQTYSLTFTLRGTYSYFCELHGSAGGGGMSGTITVQ